MPIGKCDRCLARLRFGSGTCNRCGTTKKRLKYLFAAAALMEAGIIVAHMSLPETGPRVVSDPEHAPPALVLDDPKPPAGWFYYDTRDELINDVTRHARVLSLSNPGAGSQGNRATIGMLELRHSPTYGNSVLITLKRAGFTQVEDHCQVRALFDSGEVAMFPALAGADTSNATVIISDAHDFVGKLAAARTLSVDVILSNTTERVASFPVGGLKWEL